MGSRVAPVAAALVLGIAAPAGARAAFDPASEARNFSKINERAAHEHMQPAYRVALARTFTEEAAEAAQILATDPERNFAANLCWQHGDGCAGDVRLYGWGSAGHGLVVPVLFTARSGATISGHVFATRAGPRKRPGIVITTGSVQAPEELYLFAATTLAKAGYVVVTYDVQGQGRSDTFGEAPDQGEGVPSQAGRPFYDGTEDALDFLLSTAARPYRPRPSCTSATSHAPKQERRVREGRNAAHNPFYKLVDPARIGIAGHSLGAAGVSFVGQRDPRVDAIVAWDNLRDPAASSPPACASAPATRARPPIAKPALGMSADYGLVPTPFTSEPDPQARNAASRAYTAAGVDTAQLNIRGGTHYEFSYIPNPAFGATLRGMDFVSWYTTAWFDRYVKGDRTATRRLLTRRWHQDARGAEVDPGGDGNLFSSYLRSRLAFDGVRCEDLRAGAAACPALVATDGRPADYSYLATAQTPDAPR